MRGGNFDAAITRQSGWRCKMVGTLGRYDTAQPALKINAASTAENPKTGRRLLDMVQSVYIQGSAATALPCGFFSETHYAEKP